MDTDLVGGMESNAPGKSRTCNQRIMLTTTAFAAPDATTIEFCGLDFLFALRVCH